MSLSIESVLSAQNLTKAMKDVEGGVPADLVDPVLLAGSEEIEGNWHEVQVYEDTRENATITSYGAPATETDNEPVAERSFKLIHSFESKRVKAAALQNLKSEDASGQKQVKGAQTIARQVGDSRQRNMNLRMSSLYSLFSAGKVKFDKDGNVLDPTTGGAFAEVDFEVPAGNIGDCDALGEGPIIDNPWSAAGTNIHTQLANLRAAARKLTGQKLEDAYYGTNILDHLLTNNKLKEIINRNTGFQEQVAMGLVPQGFLGFRWFPINEAFFKNKAGDFIDFFDDDALTLTPKAGTGTWYDMVEGSYLIPTNQDIGGSLSEVIGSLEQAIGMFSYAAPTLNPPGATMFYGDTFLTELLIPASIFLVDTTP